MEINNYMNSSKSSKNNARKDKGIKNKKVFTSIPLDEAWKFVENSLEEMKKQDEYICKITKLLGLEPESELRNSFYVLLDNLIESLEMLVGDETSAIEWFVHECKFGTKDFEAGCKNNSRKIKTVEDLRSMIEVDCSEGTLIDDEKGD